MPRHVNTFKEGDKIIFTKINSAHKTQTEGYLNEVSQNRVLSHFQYAKRFYQNTVYREQFYESIKYRLELNGFKESYKSSAHNWALQTLFDGDRLKTTF